MLKMLASLSSIHSYTVSETGNGVTGRQGGWMDGQPTIHCHSRSLAIPRSPRHTAMSQIKGLSTKNSHGRGKLTYVNFNGNTGILSSHIERFSGLGSGAGGFLS